MNTVDILLVAGILLSGIFCALTFSGIWHASHSDSKEGVYHVSRIVHVISALLVLIMCFIHIPLPFFYILLYVTNCFPQIICRQPREEQYREWLLINSWFLLFSAPHLIILGIMALAVRTDVPAVLGDMQLRTISLIAAVLFVAAANLILKCYLGRDKLQLLYWKSEESYSFSRFAGFCVWSVILDSIPCLFSLRTILSIAFLVGSNLLLLLMVILFAGHVYEIIRNAYLKDEYLRLQEEVLIQHSRTAQLEQEAYRDDLTRSYTRAYATLQLNGMLQGKEPFVLAFLDLDGLKKINDEQGHLAGDSYLRKFADCIRSDIYLNDIFARYGGDEFLILMPDCPMETAVLRLKNIQFSMSRSGFPFSYGAVQVWPEEGRTLEEWIAAADRAMYENKKNRQEHRRRERL